MVCLQVIGEDSIVAAAGAQGNFEDVMGPIIVNNVWIRHASSVTPEKIRLFSVEGADLDQTSIREYVGRSLLPITSLSRHVGCDKASAIDHKPDDEGTTLKAAALAMGVSEDEFDRIVDSSKMVGGPHRDLGSGPLASWATT